MNDAARRAGLLGHTLVEDGDGYRVDRDQDGLLVLVPTARWGPAADERMAAGDIDGLVCNYAHGFAEPDLAFVRPWPLQRVEVLARTVRDVRPLQQLGATLRDLRLEVDERAGLDLGAFERLHHLSAPWSMIEPTLAAAPDLRSVFTTGYAAGDLRPLAGAAPLLEHIECKQGTALTSLDGLEALPSCTHLLLWDAPRLRDLAQLPAASLEHLVVTRAEVDVVAALGDVSALRVLRLEAGPIHSLRPLVDAVSLERIALLGPAVVEDGDLSVLLQLPSLQEARIRPRRHYQPSVAEVQAALAP